MNKNHTYFRHLAKAITWRIVGTIDTILLSWMITGEPYLGLTIGGVELFTKTILYFFHERIWFKINLLKNQLFEDSRKRHFFKTITWRIVGTLDTIILAWIVTCNPLAGLKIGFSEVLTKMILYYAHERAWYHFNFGLDKKRNSIKEISDFKTN